MGDFCQNVPFLQSNWGNVQFQKRIVNIGYRAFSRCALSFKCQLARRVMPAVQLQNRVSKHASFVAHLQDAQSNIAFPKRGFYLHRASWRCAVTTSRFQNAISFWITSADLLHLILPLTILPNRASPPSDLHLLHDDNLRPTWFSVRRQRLILLRCSDASSRRKNWYALSKTHDFTAKQWWV